MKIFSVSFFVLLSMLPKGLMDLFLRYTYRKTVDCTKFFHKIRG